MFAFSIPPAYALEEESLPQFISVNAVRRPELILLVDAHFYQVVHHVQGIFGHGLHEFPVIQGGVGAPAEDARQFEIGKLAAIAVEVIPSAGGLCR